ncbi:MAG: helix-turn-helix domain-containing protein, partial [Marinobacter sp.]|nr:helix-turn-helix domain-containing protein [Marinobacter sp.]
MNPAHPFFKGVVPLLVGFLFIPFSHGEEPVPDVLTLQEAAELLRTDIQTVELMAKARTIPGRRVSIGGDSDSWRFSREALMAWLERRTAPAVPTGADKKQQTGSIGAEPVGYTATETFLREQGVLLAKNNFAFDIGLFYTRQDSQVIIG